MPSTMDVAELEEIQLSTRATQNPPSRSANRKQAWYALLGCSILQLPLWGVAMAFGIFQDAYTHQDLLQGGSSAAGVIGTTMNGVIYLAMPVLFTALDRGPWARWRRTFAYSGVVVSAAAFAISSFSTTLWHLVITQGILSALGTAMVYSPTTLYIDEHFSSGKATAYGAIFSSKNIVGTGCPLLFSALLQHIGFRWTLRLWALIVLVTGVLGMWVIPNSHTADRRLPQRVPWTFLKHRTFYIFVVANAVFSSGYGIPQTYLSSYARDVGHLSTLTSSFMITLFNVPGILSCVGFGLMSDKVGISATANTFISAFGSAVCTFLLWGLASNRMPGVLIAFAVCYGFFASGYSSTWGGWIKELEREAADANEAINTGMLYGLFNGARGIGYVVGGIASVGLLDVGGLQGSERWGYGTRYGALILFTGLSASIGAWSVAWRGYSKVKTCWRPLS